jgi:hypothetical protein
VASPSSAALSSSGFRDSPDGAGAGSNRLADLAAIQRNKTKSNPVVTNPPSDDAPPVPDVTRLLRTAPEQVIAQLNDGEVQLTLDQKGKLSALIVCRPLTRAC